MDTVPIVEIDVDFLPTAEGGRRNAIVLRGYCPELRAKTGERLSVEFLEPSDEAIEPGDGTSAIVRFTYFPGVNYDAFGEGATFEIVEGGKVVGRGRVVGYLEA